jgi:hypothetical protein
MDEVTALLSIPAAAQLHVPFKFSITIRNCNTTKSANIFVQVDTEPTDSFILSGLRSGRLPILLPDSETTLSWGAVPVECGFVKLPKISVRNLRPTVGVGEDASGADGLAVKVIRAQVPQKTFSAPTQVDSKAVQDFDSHTVLVLPDGL